LSTPLLNLAPSKGPALPKEAPPPGPVLDLSASVRGPVLVTDRGLGAQLPMLSVLPYVFVAVLVAALSLVALLYLSSWRSGEGADAPPWYLSLVEKAQQLFANGDEQEEEVLAQAAEPSEEAPAANLPQDVSAQIAALVGKSCQNFLDDGDDPAAQYAFDQLIWSRLSKEWQDSAVDRLDVCTPFKWQTSNVLSAMACAKGGCGTDDVKFYVTRDGKVGVDVTEKGNCTHAFEEGFVPTDILCSR
jgi:hypothetical protein